MDGKGEALRAVRWLIVVAVLGVWADVLLVPAPRMPIGTANGVFANPCCAALALRDGHGSSRDVDFNYVMQKGKNGPLILLDHQNLVIESGRLEMVSSKGEFLPTADGTPPIWIEVGGVKFARR